MTIKTFDLDIPFRGERSYLQGSSMYTETINALSTLFSHPLKGPFRMAIHKMTNYSCRLLYDPISGIAEKPNQYVAEFSLFSGEDSIKAWLIETDNEVTRRIPYPEFKIIEKCVLQSDAAILSEPTGLLPIEELIGITKVLHINKYPPIKFQWVFTYLELEQLLEDNLSGKMEVKLSGTIGNRTTRSTINYGGANFGSIFFSRMYQ